MTTTGTTRIERTIRIEARPETVFRFFVEPEHMVRWMGRTAELDARPGGRIRVDYNGADIVSGTYLVVEPPRRVVLTWGWEAPGDEVPPGASTVEITLEPDGDGTILTLVHRDLPTEAAVTSHAEGWDHFLGRLAAAATRD